MSRQEVRTISVSPLPVYSKKFVLGMDENCHLFGPGKETMADYLSSCNQVGGALRNEAGECLDGADNF